MDFSMITKEYIRKHDFDSDGISFRDTEKDVSYRLHQGDALPRALAQNSTKLRKEFVNLFYNHSSLQLLSPEK